jgi:hypothetical protein
MDAPIRDPKLFNYTVSLYVQNTDPTGHLSELYQFENKVDDLLLKASEPSPEKSKSIFGRIFSKSKSPEIQKVENHVRELIQQLSTASFKLNSGTSILLSGRQISIIFDELQRVTTKVKILSTLFVSEDSEKASLIEKFHALKMATVMIGKESKYEEGDDFEFPASMLEFNKALAESELLKEVYNTFITDVCVSLQAEAYSKGRHHYTHKELIAFRALLKETIRNSHSLTEVHKRELYNLDASMNRDVDQLKKEKIDPETIEKFSDFAMGSNRRSVEEDAGVEISKLFKEDVDRTVRDLVQAYTPIEEDEEDLFKPTPEEKSHSNENHSIKEAV